jgi:DNA-binding NtrC family response regulator
MPWKTNIRELDNGIEHAMIVGNGDWITAEDLPARVSETAPRRRGRVHRVRSRGRTIGSNPFRESASAAGLSRRVLARTTIRPYLV